MTIIYISNKSNNIAIRNHYICAVYASRLMVPRRQGIIVNITSIGGQCYFFSVPYGVGKAALDRMSADTSIELKEHNVAVISLFLGAVNTEGFKQIKDIPWVNPNTKQVQKYFLLIIYRNYKF